MMMENDLKRNGSGYVDEPCYKAVTAPPRPGEIWIHAKSGWQMLVLANANGVCSVLRLTDKADEDTIPVMCKVQMYTRPIMVSYCFENLLTTFVKSVKDEEMKAVRKGVVGALWLGKAAHEDEALAEEYNALQHELDGLKKQLAETKRKLEQSEIDLATKTHADMMVSEDIESMQEEITRLTIYKDMYMDIIGKLLSAKVGAAGE